MPAALDHLVVAARRLAEGEDWLTSRLGVAALSGGAHAFMGTHNRLWRLGPGEYLELIAIDPNGSPPPYARWFGLDDFTGPPRLAAWVIRTSPMIAPPGCTVMEASRGDLHWQFAVPDSGHSDCDGMAPLLIDRGNGPHPTGRMQDQGLSLTSLEITHPQPSPLPQIEDPRISYATGPAQISARIATPDGTISL